MLALVADGLSDQEIGVRLRSPPSP
ncbi:hypothetical protein ABZ958_25125 [Streptomyces sp. NPDC046237]